MNTFPKADFWLRFDGRTIRVDKASERGSGGGGGGFGGGRGGGGGGYDIFIVTSQLNVGKLIINQIRWSWRRRLWRRWLRRWT